MYKIPANLSFKAPNLHFLPSCDSTNAIAQNMVKAGSREGTVVITDDQFAGKGQTGSSWQSAAGKNLTFSLILKPTFMKPARQFLVTMMVSMAIKNTLDSYLGEEVKVKWPNDVYLREKKIAGILIENVLRGNSFDSCIVGIGLNVNQEDFQGLAGATSMKLKGGTDFDLNEVFNQLLKSLDNEYNVLRDGQEDALKQRYHESLLGKGQERQFRAGDTVFTGIIQATDEYGRLIVWTPTRTFIFNHKEVEMLF